MQKNVRLNTNNKSTGEAQPANYFKTRSDYTTECLQLVIVTLETTNSSNLQQSLTTVPA
jgi:hypothetical protein